MEASIKIWKDILKARQCVNLESLQAALQRAMCNDFEHGVNKDDNFKNI